MSLEGVKFVIVSDTNMSQRPIGATHYGPFVDGYVESWFKLTDSGFARWNGSGWGLPGEIVSKRFSSLIRCDEPVAWDGKGNPPAGTICEVDSSPTPTGWGLCEVRYSSSDVVVFIRESSSVECADLGGNSFRPVLTKEQVAGAKREDDAIALFEAVMSDPASARWGRIGNERREHFRSLVDQGWQKVPRA